MNAQMKPTEIWKARNIANNPTKVKSRSITNDTMVTRAVLNEKIAPQTIRLTTQIRTRPRAT